MMQRTQPLRGRVSGFSIIELLVVIVLSAIMMMGVTKLLSNSIVLVDSTSASSQSLERGNYAAYLLARQIRLAGFTNYFSDSSVQSINENSVAVSSISNAICSNNSCGSNGGGSVNDSLSLEYDLPLVNIDSPSTALYTTCNGAEVGRATSGAHQNVKRIREHFKVVTRTLADGVTDVSHLACESFKVVGSNVESLGSAVNVVAGVRNMQVLYGLSANADSVNVNSYTDEPIGTQKDLNDRLRSIKFSLLVETDSGAKALGNDKFNLLGELVTIPDSRGNGYRVYNSTVVLNNGGGQF